ncbi:MAG: glycerophosphodiester phosphodiesterase family protein [Chloracidobacterium sp.]|uniref:Glycerophosphodiester phosphodiesterase n=1 Tax=Chloracidobacterium validum TaxID=2821543 RepID=A0ABX8B7K6_9BACT|nr:glycerophosphodiester phosphodiesterase family protein [Chloracidobacterium validum]QUW02641.1 glycerophosphodiester phosphodiesterase [Chloracidobacterium validum]
MCPKVPPLIIFGHRGAAGTSPENTHAAFQQAFADGAHGIELDVQCCASGEVVVIHDETIDRTSTGVGRVAELSLNDLRAFDFGQWYDARFAGEGIPTLEEVFAQLPTDKVINVEIKNDHFSSRGEERAVARLIARFDLHERCLVSSFNPLVLWRVQQCDARIALAYLYRPQSPWYLRGLPVTRLLRLRALHPHHSLVTAARVALAHRLGLQVNTWTVNDLNDVERVVACGVDGIVTDYPSRLARWHASRPSSSGQGE